MDKIHAFVLMWVFFAVFLSVAFFSTYNYLYFIPMVVFTLPVILYLGSWFYGWLETPKGRDPRNGM